MRFTVNVLAFVLLLWAGRAWFGIDPTLGEFAVVLGAWFGSDFIEALIFGER